MRVRDHVVCNFPDCDWGCALPDLTESRIRKCYSEFRQHCIEKHGLDRNDMEARVHLDLIEYTFTLLKY
jgi:hypothetical protein